MLTDTSPTTPDAAPSADVRSSEHYDQLPYTSHPFPETQPARLAGLARLFGLEPPPVARARVLELGCASGGNIIPLALRFPEARFVGVDYSRRQIADGRARIARLGLTNIDLQHRDLTEFADDGEPFDYIICHGVYSWVPDEVRKAILRIAGKRLAPDGIAYVSYNVLPGWRMAQGVRDSLLLFAGQYESPTRRVAFARWLFDMMKHQTTEGTVWGQLWRAEAERLRTLPDDYLGHEFIEENNEPFAFSQFISDAERYGLAYLAEADIPSMVPENFGADVGQILRQMSSGQLIPIEQDIDILSGRPFRQTLLASTAQSAAISRNLDSSRIRGLHLVAPLGLAEVTGAAQPSAWAFSDPAGRSRLTTTSAAARNAIRRLIERLPASTATEELVAFGDSEKSQSEIIDALFRMTLVGLVFPSVEPVEGSAVIPECPLADRLAASDALAGAEFTVNPRHERVELGEVARMILPLLDGRRNRSELAAAMREEARGGGNGLRDDGASIESRKKLEASSAEDVEKVLKLVQRAGLLVDRH